MTQLDDVQAAVRRLEKKMNTGTWVPGTASAYLSGSGYVFAAGAYPAGYQVVLVTVPPYYGFEGDPLVDGQYLDVGFIQPIVRPDHSLPIVHLGPYASFFTGPGLELAGFYYFLAPGVEIYWVPLYPAT